MNDIFKRSLTPTELIVSVVVVVFLAMVLASLYTPSPGNRGQIIKSIANCLEIILALRNYAADHGGRYPDGNLLTAKDSNTVFRQLFVDGALEDERFFGAGCSRFVPEGNIGQEPNYLQAVEPGENHWAMTKGLDEPSPGGTPLVFENPVDASWPPTWNANAAEKPEKGRTWKGGRIIVGTNDTSVEIFKLESKTGARVPLKALGADGLDLFTGAPPRPGKNPYEVLDVAVPAPPANN